MDLDNLVAATPAEKKAAVAQLFGLIEKLPEGRREFAYSLNDQFHSRNGYLSANQWPWVGRLIRMAEPAPVETHTIGEMAKIDALFKLAKSRLKFPALVLVLGEATLRLSVATERAKVPGSINVVLRRPDTEEQWIGRILSGGVLEKSRRIEDAVPADLLALLNRFADDPATTAAEYGKLTGRCVFCDLAIKDPVSAEAGFGPVCATNWGLGAEYRAAKDRVKAGQGIITKPKAKRAPSTKGVDHSSA